MKILVVDDEKLIGWALKRSLERKPGVEVYCAYSGNEALKELTETAYDAIITDINMPGINGLEFIEKVRDAGLRIPTIVISSHFNLNSIDALYQLGVSKCICKPFQIQDIIVGITEATSDATHIAESFKSGILAASL